MRIVVFGANGKTGRYVVDQALGKEYEVTAFVYGSEFEAGHDNLCQIKGDVQRFGIVQRAIKGADAVVSVLGHSPKTLRNQPTMHQNGAANIVKAMNEHGVRRLVSLTGSGVRIPEDRPGFVDRMLNAGLNVVAGKMIADGRAHAQIIQESGLEWVIPRALKLMNGEKTGEYTVSPYLLPGVKGMVNRSDVADFMLRCIVEDDYLEQLPVIHR